jgi:hypothetical protein
MLVTALSVVTALSSLLSGGKSSRGFLESSRCGTHHLQAKERKDMAQNLNAWWSQIRASIFVLLETQR